MTEKRRRPLPYWEQHRAVKQVGLDEIKAKERPKFEKPSPLNDNIAYVHVRQNRRTPMWRGYLIREGFIYSRMRRCWAYCQHEDGSHTTLDECEWIADRVREMTCGDFIVTVYPGLFVEPVPSRGWRIASLPKPRSTPRSDPDGNPEWLQKAEASDRAIVRPQHEHDRGVEESGGDGPLASDERPGLHRGTDGT